MYRGRIVAVLAPEETTREQLGLLMAGSVVRQGVSGE
jgi:hypothetical protein